MHVLAELPERVELDLVETTDRLRPAVPHRPGHGTKVAVWPLRVQRDEKTGQTRKIWRMVVERRP